MYGVSPRLQSACKRSHAEPRPQGFAHTAAVLGLISQSASKVAKWWPASRRSAIGCRLSALSRGVLSVPVRLSQIRLSTS